MNYSLYCSFMILQANDTHIYNIMQNNTMISPKALLSKFGRAIFCRSYNQFLENKFLNYFALHNW